MGIKGITDSDVRFESIGRLRKGAEKRERQKGGRTITIFGEELDYFRFTSDDKALQSLFVDLYGHKPKKLSVLMPYPTAERVFSSWKESWSGGRLQHRCDGQSTVIYLEKGEYKRESKPCPGGCSEVGRLQVILPEILEAGYTGVITLETHSINDIIHIDSTLKSYEDLKGRINGLGFDIERVWKKIDVPMGKKRGKVDKCLVKIRAKSDWVLQALAKQTEERTPVVIDDINNDLFGYDDTGPLVDIPESVAPKKAHNSPYPPSFVGKDQLTLVEQRIFDDPHNDLIVAIIEDSAGYYKGKLHVTGALKKLMYTGISTGELAVKQYRAALEYAAYRQSGKSGDDAVKLVLESGNGNS